MFSKDAIYKITIPIPYPIKDVNVYVVKGDALTLVDAGMKTEEAWRVFEHKLKEIGLVPEDIEQVILTHHHPDHIGLLDFLDGDLRVLGHRLLAPWLSHDVRFFDRQKEFFLELLKQFAVPESFASHLDHLDLSLYPRNHPLTSSIQEGDEIDGMPGFTVIETPGHAQSHIVLYNEEDCRMIGGDHLLKTISSNPVLEMPYEGKERPKPQLQYNESLKKLLHIPISVVFPGHKDEFFDPHLLIRNRLDKQHERALTVLKHLEKQEMTVFALCKLLFPSAYQQELLFAISETVAQLDYLEQYGKINKRIENGVLLFSAQRRGDK